MSASSDALLKLGQNVIIEQFCIIAENGPQETTVINDNCTIRSHAVVYRGVTIGEHTHIAHHVVIRELTTIGSNVSIGTHSCIEHHVKIANNVRVHSNVFIPELTTIDEGAWIGPCVTVTNAKYPNAKQTKARLAGVTIKAGAKIGAGAILLPGVVIGERALVGAGAIVAKDVPADAVVIGSPARTVSQVSELRWDEGERVYE